jgi:ActD protein
VPNLFLVATFHDAESLLRAVRPVRRENFRLYDVFAPYPIHGLDEAMGIRRTRLPFVTLGAGLAGLATALTLQFFTNIVDWPLNVGGKPDNSTLAFIPISFELTVLFAGLATVFAFFLRAKLYPGKKERLAAPGVTNEMFALVVRKPKSAAATRRALEIFAECGAVTVAEKEADL